MMTLTTKETAQFLKLSENSVKSKAQSGEIPGAKIGNKWVFLKVDLEAHIRSQYKCAQGDMEIKCRSTNVRIHRAGGSRLPRPVESEYRKALGLKTN